MLRSVVLLVLALVLGAVISRALRPQLSRRPPGAAIETAAKCSVCGAYRIGSTACARPDCPAARR